MRSTINGMDEGKLMDTSKQPGIQIEHILLAESELRRIPQVPKDLKNNVNISVGVGFDSDKERLFVELTGVLNNPEAPVYARVKYVGIFAYETEKNMELEEYAKNSAPATLLPYVRNELHELTRKAGVPPVLIPPVNIVAEQVKSERE